jgi:hypothetical protein
MSLVESLLGYRCFASEPEIRRSIEQSKHYDASKELPEDARSLLIFDTSRQHTWLVATGERLYFVLDDVRQPVPRIRRSVPRDDLKALPDGRVAVITHSKSDRTGLVDVGLRRRGWLYSKSLFSPDRPIERAVNNLLATADGGTVGDRDVHDADVGYGSSGEQSSPHPTA